ncbi:hypothetical protein JMN32_11810 [Fulvivirga sp. 29W222]|uniref:Uncharacterized protein n=1 Tax=Fulvivirga marina TaxID=2494733 RepID=A0A937FVW4_9BACT|nr:hypothetical protein [Fulvivirga marina]MBL6446999.1 hypothetical protein [Fulvivirga marina]
MERDKRNIDLNKIPKKDIYTAPEGYFEALPDNVLKKIDEGDKGKEITLRVNWKVVGYVAAASILLLVATLIGLQNNKTDRVSAEDFLAKVSDSDLVLYLQQSEIDAYEIMEVTDIENLGLTFGNTGDFIEPQLNDPDLELLYEQYGISPDENLQMF